MRRLTSRARSRDTSATHDPLSEAPPITDVPGGADLDVRGVSVSFRGLHALQDVSMQVRAGGITALIGPNGAGKTTLLNCISGIYRSSGEVRLGGELLGDSAPHERQRRGVSRTFQTPSLLDDHDALDNVALGGHRSVRGWVGGRGGALSEAQLRERSGELLERLSISHLSSVRVGDLPHADRRRVETARALVSRPRLLLLDEPAAGLDDDESRELIAVAAELAGTCLLVEHDMALVMSVAHDVVVLAAGRVLSTGTPDDVRRDPAVVEAYLGDEVA